MADANQANTGRFAAWAALAVFSTVALTAHQTDDGGDKGGLSDAEDRFVTAVTAIAMTFGFLAMIAYFVLRERFVGRPLEGAIACLLIVLWAGGLPVIMNPSNGLAVTEDSGGRYVIDNTNLYFSSWGAFVANMFILASMAKDVGVADVSAAPPKTPMWALLFAASFVVMVSSSRFFKDNCDDGSSTCKRAKYAIALGAFATFTSMIFSFLSARAVAPLAVELGVSVFLLIMYIFGVGYITFKTGPGTTIGNLYFSTWGAFIITMILTATCVREQMFGISPERENEVPEPASVSPVDKV